MADRRVRVILEAQADAYKRGMDQAAQATDRLSDAAGRVGNSTKGMADPIREIGREWSNAARTMQSEMTTVGTGFAAMGAVITGIGASLLSVGIQYNSLQQVAGQALTQMTGSASEAADQMDRLNEFASTSPFFRDTWLNAQRQLMAFGMEAENVVPTLEGVEEAVAAIGGGDAEIMRLVDILGQIQGQGKITGRELQRMGQMGIDAASLMGESMGYTADEIRTQITAGAIDAETAIAALTDGMSTRFAGSADAIRNTFEGAKNDLIAAWRDLGAVLAEPLVGAEGGGFLVTLTNNAADFLRVLQQLPAPVLQTVGAMAGIAGVAMAGYGAMLLLVPQIVSFRDAKARLATEMPRTTGAIRGLNRAMGLVATGFLAAQLAGEAFGRSLDQIGDAEAFAETMRNLGRDGEVAASRLDELSAASLGAGGEIRDLQHAFEVLDTGGFERALKSPLGAMGAMNDEFDAAQKVITNADTALATLINEGNLDAAADGFAYMVEGLQDAGHTTSEAADYFSDLEQALYASGISMDEFLVAIGASKVVFNEATGEYENADITLQDLQDRLDGTGDAAVDAGAGMEALNEALEEIGITADGTIESLEKFISVLFEAGLLTQSVMEAESAFESQLRSVDETVQDLIETHGGLGSVLDDTGAAFDLTTEAGESAQDAFLGVADRGRALTEALAENGASQDEIQASLARTYESLVATGEGFGMTTGDAEALAAEVLGIPEGVDIDTWLDEAAKQAAEELNRELNEVERERIASILAEADTGLAVDDLDDAARDRIADILADPDSVNAEGELNETARQRIADILADPDTWSAESDLNETARRRVADIFADPDSWTAEGELNDTARRRIADITADPHSWKAESDLNNTARGRTSSITAKANTGGAERSLNWLARSRTAIMNVKTVGGGVGGSLGRAFRATGGPVYGPGTGTSDDIPAMLSNGEHVLTARDVQLMGGQRAVYEFRANLASGPRGRDMVPRYAAGGAVQARQISEAVRSGVSGIGGGGPSELTGTLYMEDGAFLGQVRMAMKNPGVVREASQSLARQTSRDRRAG